MPLCADNTRYDTNVYGLVMGMVAMGIHSILVLYGNTNLVKMKCRLTMLDKCNSFHSVSTEIENSVFWNTAKRRGKLIKIGVPLSVRLGLWAIFVLLMSYWHYLNLRSLSSYYAECG